MEKAKRQQERFRELSKKMPDKTILVADGSPEALQYIKECLSEAGYRVLTATDGASARQIARDEHPDAIMLDFNIPAAGGNDICKGLKSENGLRHVPVIFVHEKQSPEDAVAGFEAGAHDFLTKPFEKDEMLARVGAAVQVKIAYDHLLSRNRRLETLVKHVRAAMQRYEQPGAPASSNSHAEESISDSDGLARLTRREMEILGLLARGLSNEIISKQLYISPTTTRNHIQNILGKLGVHSKLEAVARAVRAGYVDFTG